MVQRLGSTADAVAWLRRVLAAGHGGGALADRAIDAQNILAALVQDGVDRDRGLAGLPVAQDQFALAAPDRNQRVDDLQPGLQRHAALVIIAQSQILYDIEKPFADGPPHIKLSILQPQVDMGPLYIAPHPALPVCLRDNSLQGAVSRHLHNDLLPFLEQR